MWTIVAALFVLCFAVATLVGRKKLPRLPSIRRQSAPPAAIDARKWSFNPETGEYYRITFTTPTHTLLSPESFGERRVRRTLAVKRLNETVYVTLLSFAIAIIGNIAERMTATGSCGVIFCDGRSTADGFAYLLVIIYPFALLALIVSIGAWTYQAIQIQLNPEFDEGPPPVPRPGREEVESQKVHGEGRMMTREEMDRALRGSAGSAPIQTFED